MSELSKYKKTLYSIAAVIVGLSIFAVAYALCGCSAINEKVGLPDDNLIEEFAETALYVESGINLDFTPNSSEKSLVQ